VKTRRKRFEDISETTPQIAVIYRAATEKRGIAENRKKEQAIYILN
jgi:hypothetical protein